MWDACAGTSCAVIILLLLLLVKSIICLIFFKKKNKCFIMAYVPLLLEEEANSHSLQDYPESSREWKIIDKSSPSEHWSMPSFLLYLSNIALSFIPFFPKNKTFPWSFDYFFWRWCCVAKDRNCNHVMCVEPKSNLLIWNLKRLIHLNKKIKNKKRR